MLRSGSAVARDPRFRHLGLCEPHATTAAVVLDEEIGTPIGVAEWQLVERGVYPTVEVARDMIDLVTEILDERRSPI